MCPRRISTTDKILKVLCAAFEDSADAVSASMSYKELHLRAWHGKRGKEAISKAIYDIKRSGYLEIVEKDNNKAVRITKKGLFRMWIPKINKEWDGRWRLVAFDIEEESRQKRDNFRDALKIMGFRMMQKSLWICPFDISEEIEKVIDMLDIESNVDYFIADAITNREKFIIMFDLNQ